MVRELYLAGRWNHFGRCEELLQPITFQLNAKPRHLCKNSGLSLALYKQLHLVQFRVIASHGAR